MGGSFALRSGTSIVLICFLVSREWLPKSCARRTFGLHLRKAPTLSRIRIFLHSLPIRQTPTHSLKPPIFIHQSYKHGFRTDFAHQFSTLHTLLIQDKRFDCITQGKRNLQNLWLPPLWRVRALWVLVQAEDDWRKAEVSCESIDQLEIIDALTQI